MLFFLRTTVEWLFNKSIIQKIIMERFIMKKIFKMEDLDCANCAAKMEEAIKKIDGVTFASINFMAQKLTIEADEARFDEIMKQAIKACKKVEPDCTIIL